MSVELLKALLLVRYIVTSLPSQLSRNLEQAGIFICGAFVKPVKLLPLSVCISQLCKQSEVRKFYVGQ
jgi:hypothetical protein